MGMFGLAITNGEVYCDVDHPIRPAAFKQRSLSSHIDIADGGFYRWVGLS